MEIFNRIEKGKYGQDNLREFMASKFNIRIRAYDANTGALLIERPIIKEIDLSQYYGTNLL